MHAIVEQISNILLKAASNKHELWWGTSEKVGIPDLQHYSDVYFVIVSIVNLHSEHSWQETAHNLTLDQIVVTLGARYVRVTLGARYMLL